MLPISKEALHKQYKYFQALITIIGGLSVAGTAYYLYRNNIWKPKVEVLKYDFNAGVAVISINGKEKILYENSTLNAGGIYGVRFAGPTGSTPTRIELLKNGLVVDTLVTKPMM